MAKDKPTPCTCGREPVTAKVKGGGWVLTCPAGLICKHHPTSGRWPREDHATAAWNTAIRVLKNKEAKK